MLTIARRTLDLDRNVLKVLGFRLWTILAGIVTVVAIPRFLNGESQGYYYTFLSIVALQALFDLGLSQTVAQVSSHEFAHVDLDLLEKVDFTPHVAKLAYVKATITRWYRWVGGAFIAIVALVGVGYFGLFGAKVDGHWLGPWIGLVVTTGINLILSPRLAIVEGAGWTGAVATVRLVQSIMGYVLLVIALAAGAGLWSAMMVPLAANLVSAVWLRGRPNPYRAIPPYPSAGHDHERWRAEILGLQWRVAIAWLGGYFASQVIVPVVFALQGPEPAGRIGLGLQIFGAVQALGMSWISARVPRFGHLIARGDYNVLKEQFVRAATSATWMSAVVAFSVVAVLALARGTGVFLAQRIPSMQVTVLLAGVAVLGTSIYAMAAYMRAHKEEPLVLSSLVIGGMTLLAATAGARLGGDAVVFAYACVTLFLNLPWTVVIFRRYYRRDTRGL
ncbi:hypothetical protein [uncultured Sphingomonas sp.]|uniref:hypothetical protein n=1 Tax=uncultured Sphingomonas sp. TaxID=158754 RepID=UPI0025F1F009|nr:hypothetical protein [uncultured Sphingomonas sp.]